MHYGTVVYTSLSYMRQRLLWDFNLKWWTLETRQTGELHTYDQDVSSLCSGVGFLCFPKQQGDEVMRMALGSS